MGFRKLPLFCSGAMIFFGVFVDNNAQAMQIEKLAIVAAGDIQPAESGSVDQDMPMGQSSEKQYSLLPESTAGSDEALFGKRGGYIHPYVMFQEKFTDNIYNLNTNTTSGFLTTISPGVWFALPRKKDIPVTISPHNTSPGGLQHQFKDHEGTDRIQAYALGGLDFHLNSDNSDYNTTDGVLEGMFRYNMRGGLSLQVVDRFSRGEEKYDFSNYNDKESYNSNFLLTTADYKITEKVRTKLEYSNFWLNYNSIYGFRDRIDNAVDFYGYYVYSVKTSLFVEDKYVKVSYSSEGNANDNTQNFIFGGIKWDTTEKLAVLAKAGWQKRNFDDNDNGRKDYSGLAADLQLQYKATEKTKLTFDFYKTDEETDYSQASGKAVVGASFVYDQKFTDKISGKLNVIYENDDYAQLIPQDRSDNRLFIRPAVQYLFRDWLQGELAYEFDKRDSTYDLFDYQSNAILLNLKFAL